ncbi:MAG: hypothetical protein R3Y29_08770, partial [bacterium]
NQNKKPSDAIGDFKESLSENNIDFGTSILDLGLGLDDDLDDDLAQVQDGYLSKEDALSSLDLLAQENIEAFDDILNLDNLDEIKLMIIKNQAVSSNIKFLQDNNRIKNGMYSLPIELASGKISDLNMFIVNDSALNDKNLTMYLNFTNDNNKQVQAYVKSEDGGKLVRVVGVGEENQEENAGDITKILEKFNIFPDRLVYDSGDSNQETNIFKDQILI